MSQAKVDKYKEEKKNRAKTVKKARIKKVTNVLLGAAIVGVIIGFPLGRFAYNRYYDKKMENATVSSAMYDYWFSEYWNLHHADKFYTNTVNQDGLTDQQIQELVDELSSSSDAVIVTPDDLDQDALEEAIENASSTDAN